MLVLCASDYDNSFQYIFFLTCESSSTDVSLSPYLLQLCLRNLSRDDFCPEDEPMQCWSWSPPAVWGEGQLPLNISSRRPICAALERFAFILQLRPQTLTLSSSAVLFLFLEWMSVSLVVWYHEAKYRTRSKPVWQSRGISQQVRERNVATLFLKLDDRKSLCSFHGVNALLSSATCRVSTIKSS